MSTATRLGVAGISLGGSFPSLAAAVDPAIREGAFLLAGGDLSTILWEMPEGAAYPQALDRIGPDQTDLKALTDPFDPLTYADRLVGKRVLMIAGKVDEVVPPRRRCPLGSGGPAADPLVRLRPLLGGRLSAARHSRPSISCVPEIHRSAQTV